MSSPTRPSWVLSLIRHSRSQLSDIGASFFSSCLSASKRQQTSSSMSRSMGTFIQQLLVQQQNTPAPPGLCLLPFPSGESYCFKSYSLRAYTSDLTFSRWRCPESYLGECLGLMGGQAESAHGHRAVPSGSVSGDQKLGGGVWARVTHET